MSAKMQNAKIKHEINIYVGEAGLLKYVVIFAHMQPHDHKIQEKDEC
jgi:hypothetical protein